MKEYFKIKSQKAVLRSIILRLEGLHILKGLSSSQLYSLKLAKDKLDALERREKDLFN